MTRLRSTIQGATNKSDALNRFLNDFLRRRRASSQKTAATRDVADTFIVTWREPVRILDFLTAYK